MPNDTDESAPYSGRDRCRVTRKKDGGVCRNPAVAELGICARHLRDRAEAIRLSGGLDVDVPGSGES